MPRPRPRQQVKPTRSQPLDIFRYLAKYSHVRTVLGITKALADSNRLRILIALRSQELCVCQITELLRLAPSTVSKHLAILQASGLLDSRKDERWVYYRWPDRTAGSEVRAALDWISKSLEDDARITEDHRHLKTILRQDPKLLCQRQTRR